MAATWRKRWLPSLPLSVTVFCFWLLMNDEISVGQVVMALVLALVQSFVPLLGAWREQPALMAVARPAAKSNRAPAGRSDLRFISSGFRSGVNQAP